MTTIAILSVKHPEARDHLMGLEQPVPANNNAGTVKAFLATEAACTAQITSTLDDNNFVKVQTIFESVDDDPIATPSRLAFRLLQNHHVSQSASVVRNAEEELNGLFFPSAATPDTVGTWLAVNQRLYNTINSHGGAMTPRNFALGVVARVPQDTTYGAYITIVEQGDADTYSFERISTDLVNISRRSSSRQSRLEGKETVLVASRPTPLEQELSSLREQVSLLTTRFGNQATHPKREHQSSTGRFTSDRKAAKLAAMSPSERAQFQADVAAGICHNSRKGKCTFSNCRYKHLTHTSNIAYCLVTTSPNSVDEELGEEVLADLEAHYEYYVTGPAMREAFKISAGVISSQSSQDFNNEKCDSARTETTRSDERNDIPALLVLDNDNGDDDDGKVADPRFF